MVWPVSSNRLKKKRTWNRVNIQTERDGGFSITVQHCKGPNRFHLWEKSRFFSFLHESQKQLLKGWNVRWLGEEKRGEPGYCALRQEYHYYTWIASIVSVSWSLSTWPIGQHVRVALSFSGYIFQLIFSWLVFTRQVWSHQFDWTSIFRKRYFKEPHVPDFLFRVFGKNKRIQTQPPAKSDLSSVLLQSDIGVNCRVTRTHVQEHDNIGFRGY